MPYIKQEDKVIFDDDACRLARRIRDAGELNYVLTTIAVEYLSTRPLKYAEISAVKGYYRTYEMSFNAG